jgi:RHS repeat-associated protein
VPNRIASWTYDGNGNVLQEGPVARGFTYDAETRQVTACLNCAPGPPTATYMYDGQGQRVSKTVGGQTTTYVYDAFGNLAAEYGGDSSACGTCYVTTDHLGSTRLLTNSAGGVFARYDYEPFGREIGANYDGRSAPMGYTAMLDDTNPKFTGQMRDYETTLDWFNVRYYSGWQGRFQSPDPGNAGADPSNPQSWNGYAYVNNNPLSYTDPSGMMTEPSSGSGDDPSGGILGVLIDLGELLGDIFGGGGPPPSIAPSLATPSSPILQPSPDFDSQGWSEQVAGSGSGSVDTGTLFGSGNTSPFVFSWQQPGQAGGLAPGDVPITSPYFPALVLGMHRAAGPVHAAFIATGVVAAIPAIIPAVSAAGGATLTGVNRALLGPLTNRIFWSGGTAVMLKGGGTRK